MFGYECRFGMGFSGGPFKIIALLLDIAITFHAGAVLVTVLRGAFPVLT